MSSLRGFDPYPYRYDSPHGSFHTASPFAPHIPMHGGVGILNVSTFGSTTVRAQGTVGGVVRKGNQNYLISNKHVFANVKPTRPGNVDFESALRTHKITKATNIYGLKGGPLAKGQVIAKTVPSMQNPNMDVGFAIPSVPVRWDIPGIGIPKGVVEPTVGMRIVKVGATTGKTISQIWWLDQSPMGKGSFTAYSGYGKTADHGDSGGLAFEEGTGRVVGLITSTDIKTGRYLFGHNATLIESTFGVSFTPPGVVRSSTTPAPTTAPVGQKPTAPPPTPTVGPDTTGTSTGNPLLDMINNLLGQLLALLGMK